MPLPEEAVRCYEGFFQQRPSSGWILPGPTIARLWRRCTSTCRNLGEYFEGCRLPTPTRPSPTPVRLRRGMVESKSFVQYMPQALPPFPCSKEVRTEGLDIEIMSPQQAFTCLM